MVTRALSDFSFSFDLILPNLSVSGERQLATSIARAVSPKIGISERILAERLIESERRTPSALGQGAAIAQLSLSGLSQAFYVFARLKQPVSRPAPDGAPVDIVCVLFTPEREGNSYLRVMARLSRLLSQKEISARLRATTDEREIRAIFEQQNMLSKAA